MNLTVAKNCTCNKCLVEAHAIPNSRHRRCPGSAPSEGESVKLRAKDGKIPFVQRGKWE